MSAAHVSRVTRQQPTCHVSRVSTPDPALSSATTLSTDAKQFQDNNDYAFAGSNVKFTCSYTNPKNLAAPGVTWTAKATKGGGDIAVGTPDETSAGSFEVSIGVRRCFVESENSKWCCHESK